jgi:hypothetical protein
MSISGETASPQEGEKILPALSEYPLPPVSQKFQTLART